MKTIYKTISKVDVDYSFLEHIDSKIKKRCMIDILSWNKDKKIIKAYGYKNCDLIIISSNSLGHIIGERGYTISKCINELNNRIDSLNNSLIKFESKIPELKFHERYRNCKIILRDCIMLGTFSEMTYKEINSILEN